MRTIYVVHLVERYSEGKRESKKDKHWNNARSGKLVKSSGFARCGKGGVTNFVHFEKLTL